MLSGGVHGGGAQAARFEAQLQQLERDAYLAVLRAFGAQSEAITWAKERLMTELRKELNIPDEVHRDLLNRAHDDHIIRQICEWRKTQPPGGTHYHPAALAVAAAPPMGITSGAVGGLTMPPAAAGGALDASASGGGPRKRMKVAAAAAAAAAGGPGVGTAGVGGGGGLEYGAGVGLPPPGGVGGGGGDAAKRGGHVGGRGRKRGRGGLISSRSVGSSAAGGRGGGGVGAQRGDPRDLLGRRVKTKWQEGGVSRFYEAVISDYNELDGTHSLVYDFNTADESFEWVNLAKIPKDDIIWVEGPKVDLTVRPPAPAPAAAAVADAASSQQLQQQRGSSKATEAVLGLGSLAEKWASVSVGPLGGGLSVDEWVRRVANLPPLLSILPLEGIRQEEDAQKLHEAKRMIQEREREIQDALQALDDEDEEDEDGDGTDRGEASRRADGRDVDEEGEKRRREDEDDEEDDEDGGGHENRAVAAAASSSPGKRDGPSDGITANTDVRTYGRKRPRERRRLNEDDDDQGRASSGRDEDSESRPGYSGPSAGDEGKGEIPRREDSDEGVKEKGTSQGKDKGKGKEMGEEASRERSSSGGSRKLSEQQASGSRQHGGASGPGRGGRGDRSSDNDSSSDEGEGPSRSSGRAEKSARRDGHGDDD